MLRIVDKQFFCCIRIIYEIFNCFLALILYWQILVNIMLTNLPTLMRCSSDEILSKNHMNDDEVTPCSGHGDCLNGTCICEIRYSGKECDNYNFPYHASKLLASHLDRSIMTKFCFSSIQGVSSVFYFVAALSMIQLLICCVAEYQRLKQPSVLKAARVTTQKLLYFVVFVAALLRGAYFTTPVSTKTNSRFVNNP